MTVSSLEPVNNYAGNNSVRIFDFDFLIENEKELKVSILNLDTNMVSELVFGIDYSINEIGNKNGSYISFPLQTSSFGVLKENQIISLSLSLPIKQESEFENSSDLKLDVLEWTFDYIVRLLQVLNRKVERAIKIEEGEEFSSGDELVSTIFNFANKVENKAELVSKKAEETLINSQNTLTALKQVEAKANNNLDNLTSKGIDLIKEYVGKGQPIGTIFPLNSTISYTPEGCLPCDGTEYSKTQFPQLWDNYLIGKDVFAPDRVNIVGSPTITDEGVASGFSESDYIILGEGLLVDANTWEIEFDYDTTNAPTNFTGTIFCNVQISPSYKGLVIQGRYNSISLFGGSDNGATWDVFNNILISINQYGLNKIKLGYNGIKYFCFVNGIEKWSLESNTKIDFPKVNCVLGYHAWWSGLQYGSIDLKEFSVISNEQTVFDCVKQNPLLNTCSYTDYETDITTYGQCSKFAIKPLEYDGSKLTIVGSPTITENGIASGFSVYQDCLKTIIDFSSLDSFSISGAFYKDNTTGTGLHQTIFELCDRTNGRSRLALYNPSTSPNDLVLQYPTSATSEYTTSFITFALYQWHSFEIKYDSGILNLYIDGIKKTNDIAVDKSWLEYSFELWIGASHNVSPYSKGFLGAIDLKKFSIISKEKTIFDCIEGTTFKVPTITSENENLKNFVVVSNGVVEDSNVDWEEWASSLQGKANKDLSNCTKPYVIETSDESIYPSWYRIWSDGWCEQGGITTGGTTSTGKQVSLLKNLKESYSLRAYVLGATDSFNTAGTWVKTCAITNSSFYIVSGFTGASTSEYAAYDCSWEAKGYLQ